MAHEINYANIPEVQKMERALDDVKFWLGDRFEHITNAMKAAKTQDEFEIAASFVGVQGFPVIAWYEHIHGKDSWVD